MSRLKLHRLISIFLLLPLISAIGVAANGSINGIVRDSQTGEPLPGANVMLVHSSMGASTDLDGKFAIQNVAPGSYTLRATYVGYKEKTVTVQVKDGTALKQDFRLVAIAVEGEEVVVTAQAAGQKGAINQQLASMPITNVVSRARIQELPDVNAAESVSRLPGVSLIRTGGEGSRVVIRGLSPQYNQITIEGVEQPSNVNSANNVTYFNEFDNGTSVPNVLGDRGMDLSMISSSMLGGIEVIKAITPDMDASVLGGIVNFDMRKAARELEPEVAGYTWFPKFELGSQAGYNNLRDSYQDYKFVGSVEKRFLDETIGIFAQGSAERRNLSAHELSVDYWLYDKDHGDAGLPELNSATLTDTKRLRERLGGTLVLDYQHETGSIGLMNTLSRSTTASTRSEEALTWRSNDLRFTVRESNATLSVLSNILSVKQELGSFRLDFKVSHNYSENSEPGSLRLNFWQRYAPSGFQNRGNLARLTPQELASFATPNIAGSSLADAGITDEYTDERSINSALDVETTLPISSDFSGKLKVGGAFLYRTRSYDLYNNGNVEYFRGGSTIDQITAQHPDWRSTSQAGTLAMMPFVTGQFLSGSFLEGGFPYPITLSPHHIRPYLAILTAANPESNNHQNKLANYFNDYSGNEKKSAAYAMFTLNVGDNIKILPGVRYQNLTSSYEAWRGRMLPNNQIQGNDTTVTVSHGYWLPMLHARYQPFEWLQLHFAYTNTLNYPDYGTITPRYVIGNAVVFYNNWRIKPARSENLDLVVAFHSNEIGLFMVNGFKKRITDLILSHLCERPEHLSGSLAVEGATLRV
jgi:TonB-dependent receptor